MQGIFFVLASAAFNVLGQFLLKFGIAKVGLKVITATSVLKAIFSPFVFAGLTAYVVSSIFWIIALSKAQLSVAYPIVVSLSIIFVLGISWLFLSEEINAMRIFGVFLVMLGVYFIFKSA